MACGTEQRVVCLIEVYAARCACCESPMGTTSEPLQLTMLCMFCSKEQEEVLSFFGVVYRILRAPLSRHFNPWGVSKHVKNWLAKEGGEQQPPYMEEQKRYAHNTGVELDENDVAGSVDKMFAMFHNKKK